MQVSSLGDGGPDDLPRAFRRERDAQTHAAQSGQTRGYVPAQPIDAGTLGDDPVNVTVTRLKVPFLNLVFFFLKCTLAAVPALLLLMLILFGIGQAVLKIAPDFALARIIIMGPGKAGQ